MTDWPSSIQKQDQDNDADDLPMLEKLIQFSLSDILPKEFALDHDENDCPPPPVVQCRQHRRASNLLPRSCHPLAHSPLHILDMSQYGLGKY